jgi:archaemetzincin
MKALLFAALLMGVISAAATQDLSAVRAAGRKLAPLQTKLGPPKPGEWLARHREYGQTFDQYVASNPNRPTAQRSTIFIQPIGTFAGQQQRLLEDTIEMMKAFFGTSVETLEPLPLEVIPARARRVHPTWNVPQILTGYVLDEILKPKRPQNAVAVLALTTSDLWPGEGWNFVFGQASLDARVGVWSLARFGDPEKDYVQALRRTLATATHETGHMLGIPHCIAFECGMNGSNSLDESDRRRLGFCVECEEKIWWACHVDPAKRYETLVKFATSHRLEREEREWRAALEALK